MNTQLNVVICGESEALCTSVFQTIDKLLSNYELILSRYNTSAELYRLNQTAHLKPIVVSEILWDAIDLGRTYFQRSNGYFDISLGSIYQTIKEHKTNPVKPEYNLIQHLEIDQQNRTVFFSNQNISLDFGGLGKGIVLNEIAKLLDKNGIENALISFGGSSILTRGKHPHGDYWPLSLQANSEKIWKLNNHAVSISGTHLQSGNEEIKHIINPYIFKAIPLGKIAVVRSANPIDAEALSTTLLAAPESQYNKIASAFHDAEFDIM